MILWCLPSTLFWMVVRLMRHLYHLAFSAYFVEHCSCTTCTCRSRQVTVWWSRDFSPQIWYIRWRKRHIDVQACEYDMANNVPIIQIMKPLLKILIQYHTVSCVAANAQSTPKSALLASSSMISRSLDTGLIFHKGSKLWSWAATELRLDVPVCRGWRGKCNLRWRSENIWSYRILVMSVQSTLNIGTKVNLLKQASPSSLQSGMQQPE